MFQGSGTNLKSWNESTQSKFLDRLKKLGRVYTYQDKVNNIWHYNMKDKEHIDFDLNYVRPDLHIKMVYDDIQSKIILKNINLFLSVGVLVVCLRYILLSYIKHIVFILFF